MMETITQNCGLYLAYKLTNSDERPSLRWWQRGHANKNKRIVRKARGLRRIHMQEGNSSLHPDRFLLV